MSSRTVIALALVAAALAGSSRALAQAATDTTNENLHDHDGRRHHHHHGRDHDRPGAAARAQAGGAHPQAGRADRVHGRQEHAEARHPRVRVRDPQAALRRIRIRPPGRRAPSWTSGCRTSTSSSSFLDRDPVTLAVMGRRLLRAARQATGRQRSPDRRAAVAVRDGEGPPAHPPSRRGDLHLRPPVREPAISPGAVQRRRPDPRRPARPDGPVPRHADLLPHRHRPLPGLRGRHPVRRPPRRRTLTRPPR